MADNRGAVQFSVSEGDVAVLGLRFLGEAFTPIPISRTELAWLRSTETLPSGMDITRNDCAQPEIQAWAAKKGQPDGCSFLAFVAIS
jgi:hypothetical protein